MALNALQTNSATLKESIGRTHNAQCSHVEETHRYLEKVGVKLEDLDQLSVIHVAGTKGKVTIYISNLIHLCDNICFDQTGINLCTCRINFTQCRS